VGRDAYPTVAGAWYGTCRRGKFCSPSSTATRSLRLHHHRTVFHHLSKNHLACSTNLPSKLPCFAHVLLVVGDTEIFCRDSPARWPRPPNSAYHPLRLQIWLDSWKKRPGGLLRSNSQLATFSNRTNGCAK